MNAIEQLRAAVAGLRQAAIEERIEPDGALGIWLAAQVTTLEALAGLVQEQTARVEEKAAVVERAMAAQVERVKAAVEEARALTSRLRVEIEDSKERRKDGNLALAKELGEGIKDTLKTSLLIRERRWNRRQNWSAAALAASVLIGCFVAGVGWSDYSRPGGAVQDVMDRCVARKVLDEVTRQYFCPVKVVLGQS